MLSFSLLSFFVLLLSVFSQKEVSDICQKLYPFFHNNLIFFFGLLFITGVTKRSTICGRTSSIKTKDSVNEFCEVDMAAAR